MVPPRLTRTRQQASPQVPLIWLVVFCSVVLAILLWSQLKIHHLTEATIGGRTIWVRPEYPAFNQYKDVAGATHLIVVAGHSVIVSGHLHDADVDESDWFLLNYQKDQGLPQAIVAHIKEGIRLASLDPKSLLIFSAGGPDVHPGPMDAGTSYYQVADAMNLWRGSTVRSRTATERLSLDSFQNLLFAICRFFELTGRYPNQITVVSFNFKRRRFEELHVPALQWPSSKFSYVGIDPDASTGFDAKRSAKGELEYAAKPFETDPYGCHSDILRDKREERNPFRHAIPYELSCPTMTSLLKWCGPSLISEAQVPW